MTAWHVHKWWLLLSALVLTVTCSLDAAVGGLVAKPFPWVMLIPSTLPLTVVLLVALPFLKEEARKSRTGSRERD